MYSSIVHNPHQTCDHQVLEKKNHIDVRAKGVS